MRNKVFRALTQCRCKVPMNLQLFAEGDGAGSGDDSGSGEGDDSGVSGDDKPQSFDDFLKGEGNQAEFDRRVNKAIHTAVQKAQEKWEALTNDKLSEAEKLAKMNKDEKAQYMQQKKEKELADREAAITKGELKAEAKNTLAEKKLPASLADLLVYTDADSCNKSIATVEKIFQEAVEAAVQEKLKGGDPQKKAPEGNKELETQIEKLMRGY